MLVDEIFCAVRAEIATALAKASRSAAETSGAVLGVDRSFRGGRPRVRALEGHAEARKSVV
jgi:hypothetical protein